MVGSPSVEVKSRGKEGYKRRKVQVEVTRGGRVLTSPLN